MDSFNLPITRICFEGINQVVYKCWTLYKWSTSTNHFLFIYMLLLNRVKYSIRKCYGTEILTLNICFYVLWQEGITLTMESFSHLARDSSYSRCCSSTEQSKAEKLLGGGKGWNTMFYLALHCSYIHQSCFALLS